MYDVSLCMTSLWILSCGVSYKRIADTRIYKKNIIYILLLRIKPYQRFRKPLFQFDFLMSLAKIPL